MRTFNMLRPCLFLAVFVNVASAQWSRLEDTRAVEAGGKKFSCTYNLLYKGQVVVNTKKSLIVCLPDLKTNIEHTEYFKINNKQVAILHKIKKKKDFIIKATVSELTTTTTTTTPAPPTLPPTAAPGGGGGSGGFDGALSCSCKMPMMSTPMATGRSMGEVLMRSASNRGGGSHEVSSGSSDGGIFLLLTVFLVSLLGGFLGSGLLALLTGSANRDLSSQMKMDMRHASILHNLQVSDRQFGIDMNSVAEALIGHMTSNPEVMQGFINAAIESGAIESAVQQAAESGALAEAITNIIESGAIEAAFQGAIENGLVQGPTPEELLSGIDFEAMMASLDEMLGQMDEGAMEEAFQNMINSIDPQMMEGLMSAFSNTEMNMECVCAPSE